MTKTIEVEIDESGTVRPMDPSDALPHGRALLVWQTETMRRSQPSTQPSRMVIADNGLAFFPANGRVLTPEMVKAAQEDEID
jgi:hypothetical protein